MQKYSICAMVIFYTLATSSHANDQTNPDARLVEQQQRVDERERNRVQPNVRLNTGKQTEQQLSLKSLPENERPCVPVYDISLDIPKAYSGRGFMRQLLPSLDPLKYGTDRKKTGAVLGKCIGNQGLGYIADQFQNKLIKNGFVTTRVDILPQDIKATGKLVITVIPGLVGDVRYAELPSDIPEQIKKRLDDSFFAQRRPILNNSMVVKRGELLNVHDIETSLENYRRLSSVDVKIDIAPSKENTPETQAQDVGYSDLLISWVQARPLSGSLSLDDAGSESSGKYQATLALTLDNPLTLNDQLNISANRGIARFGRVNNPNNTNLGLNLDYSIPFGRTLLTLGHSLYDFDEFVGDNAVEYSGRSRNYDIKARRLIGRGQRHKTYATVGGYRKRSNNTFGGGSLDEVSGRKTAGWTVGVDHTHYLPFGTLDIGVNYKRGTGALRSLPAPESNLPPIIDVVTGAVTEREDEGLYRIGIINYNASLDVPFAVGKKQVNYRMRLRGQYTKSPATVPDWFQVGGRYSARGAKQSISGDTGYLVQHDLIWQPTSLPVQTYVGLDYGSVGGNKTLRGNETIGDTELLTGVLGMRAFVNNIQAHAFVGHGIIQPNDFDKKPAAGFNITLVF